MHEVALGWSFVATHIDAILHLYYVLLSRNRLTNKQIRRINALVTEMAGPVGKSNLYETTIPIIDAIHIDKTEARKIHLNR